MRAEVFEARAAFSKMLKRASRPRSRSQRNACGSEAHPDPKPELIAALEHSSPPPGFCWAGHGLLPPAPKCNGFPVAHPRPTLWSRSSARWSHSTTMQASTSKGGGDGRWEAEHDVEALISTWPTLRLTLLGSRTWWIGRSVSPPAAGARPRGISVDRHFLGIRVACELEACWF